MDCVELMVESMVDLSRLVELPVAELSDSWLYTVFFNFQSRPTQILAEEPCRTVQCKSDLSMCSFWKFVDPSFSIQVAWKHSNFTDIIIYTLVWPNHATLYIYRFTITLISQSIQIYTSGIMSTKYCKKQVFFLVSSLQLEKHKPY